MGEAANGETGQPDGGHGPAPVALFVHSRPQHAARTLRALADNPMAPATRVYVFADGARDGREAPQVAATRAAVRAAEGCFRGLFVVERAHNLGLADNIVSGVDQVLREHGRAIVLEDDLLTAPGFLQFMNAGLARYADTPRVMQVSGYQLPLDTRGLAPVALTRWAACWGWATWARAWQGFDFRGADRDAGQVLARMSPAMRAAFDLDGPGTDFVAQLEANRDGLLRSWAVFWYAHIFLHDGLCLCPRTSLVRNIGHDGSGVHSRITTRYDGPLASQPIPDLSTPLREDPLLLQRIQAFYRAHREPPLRTAARRLKHRLLRRLPLGRLSGRSAPATQALLRWLRR